MINSILNDAEKRMKKTANSTADKLSSIRTGHATPSLLDNIKVDYYGSKTPLNQLANVAAPDTRLLVVQVYDKNSVDNVDKAIKSSDLGLNPQVEGNVLKIPIPKLSEERRKEMVKYAHELTEEGKIAIRNIRRDAKTDIEELENEHEISEDDAHRALEELQNITDKYTDKVSDLLEKKEEEILEE